MVERNRLGAVDTSLTTAHLTYVTDLRLANLVKYFGKEGAALTWQAGMAAVDEIERIVNQLQIRCDFHRCDGYLHESILAHGDESESLQEDAEWAQQLGFSVEFLKHVPYFNRPGIRFPNQAKFHPLKYLAAVAIAVDEGGGKIYEQSEVTAIESDPLRVMIGKHQLMADNLLIATHVPLQGNAGLLDATLFQTKLYPYSSYVLGAHIPKGLIPDASFWDTTDPYFFLRVEPGRNRDYAIFGGNDHKTGQTFDNEQRFEKLREILLTIIPEAQPDRQWSGQVIATNDGLPYIGETADRQFVATGFNGNGITFGLVGGMMIRDAVLGRENPWREIFSIGRKKLHGGSWNFLTESLDYPYYYVKDRLTRSEGNDVSEVNPGAGRILLLDGERVACSRDENGKLSAVSAVCTHMGCLVHWNNAESTWDCPCHGSRFKASGEVMAGPAESPLEMVVTAESSRKNGKPRTIATKSGRRKKKANSKTDRRAKRGVRKRVTSRKSRPRR